MYNLIQMALAAVELMHPGYQITETDQNGGVTAPTTFEPLQR